MRRLVFLVLLLCGFAQCANGLRAQNIARGVQVVVIDAGHGGPNFPGAHYGGVYEKDLNLAVALKLGKLIEQRLPQIKVVYTRKTDKQYSTSLTKDLQARADIANNAGGDLFISIHTNAAAATSATGVETLIMGETPTETRINEEVLYANNKEEFIDMSDERTAAVVRAYIQNLQFTYGEYSEAMGRLVQKNFKASGRRDRGVKPQLLKVLYATDMPGVLVEIGFMTNSAELKYMCSAKGQDEIAATLFKSVCDYVDFVRSTLLVEEDAAAAPAAPPAATVSSEPVDTAGDPALKEGYTVQVLASTKRLKADDWQFKTYKNKVIEFRSKGRYKYKYAVGRFASREAAQRALAEVRKTFGDAYVVRFDGSSVD